ncbi:MAG: hypothetical protein CML89_05435 [Rhodobiaceae bacterium]|nr:hypothetical protein [Rhodobiaceae bacterium]
MLRIISFFSLIIFLMINIYHYNVSYDVIKLEKKIYKIENEILDEQNNETQLITEWAIITSPKNLEKLANRYSKSLNLKPVTGNQILINSQSKDEVN